MLCPSAIIWKFKYVCIKIYICFRYRHVVMFFILKPITIDCINIFGESEREREWGFGEKKREEEEERYFIENAHQI